MLSCSFLQEVDLKVCSLFLLNFDYVISGALYWKNLGNMNQKGKFEVYNHNFSFWGSIQLQFLFMKAPYVFTSTIMIHVEINTQNLTTHSTQYEIISN